MSGQSRTVHVPYTLERDEDGVWCAHAWLGSSGRANGNGSTQEEAIADLRKAVQIVIEEDGIPAQLRRTPRPRGCLTRPCRHYLALASSRRSKLRASLSPRREAVTTG